MLWRRNAFFHVWLKFFITFNNNAFDKMKWAFSLPNKSVKKSAFCKLKFYKINEVLVRNAFQRKPNTDGRTWCGVGGSGGALRSFPRERVLFREYTFLPMASEASKTCMNQITGSRDCRKWRSDPGGIATLGAHLMTILSPSAGRPAAKSNRPAPGF